MYALLGTHREEDFQSMTSRLIARMGYEVTIVDSVDFMLEAMGVKPGSGEISDKFQIYAMDVNLCYPGSERLEALKVLPYIPPDIRLITFSGNDRAVELAKKAGLEAHTTLDLIQAFR